MLSSESSSAKALHRHPLNVAENGNLLLTTHSYMQAVSGNRLFFLTFFFTTLQAQRIKALEDEVVSLENALLDARRRLDNIDVKLLSATDRRFLQAQEAAGNNSACFQRG